ncbi:MAG: hypothetical protein A3F67_09125 [Verrucomicrobia bacterium RIFCSPHIGHO2_12_FULL_41_10]|nr:MAG: hypothetical protein A3F67_09125 [Verrucomicrobia bacterium RIFCSPHIGHO2_12_FULL_41_10]
MGSRYGGLKQLDPVGPRGEILLDYSVYDAVAAGFSEVIFIIRKDIEEAFRQTIGDRYRDAFPELKVRYAFQELHDLPEGFTPPVGRTKPWGTGHALLAARRLVQSPFAVINADDYYGASGYRVLQQFLTKASHGSYAMVGYHLKNTLSEHGSVSRGICHSRSDEFLINIIERTTIRRASGKNCIVAEEKDGQIIHLTGEELVSLNFWGFTPDLFVHLEKEFSKFLKDHLHEENQLTAEFYLPSAINNLIKKETASVRLFPTSDPWFGLTYPADLPQVKKALQRMVVNIRATGRI